MVLIVEDGSVVANADSFLSLVDARMLATNYGLELPVDDVAAEVVLRQGYLNLLTYESRLQGSRVGAIQTGVYPRSGVLNNCFPVNSDVIPKEIQLAQLYAADAFTKGANNNEVNTGEKLSGFKVVGVYEETYQNGSSAKLNATIQGVTNSLYPLTKTGLANSPCGSGGGLSRENMGYLG